jgi:O-antigen/teichoic acid export membrane protein
MRSSIFNISSSGVQMVVQFVRSIFLARLLAPDDFGLYAFAFSFVVATRAIPQFGLGGALLHRERQSEGEQALRVHFTLSVLFSLIWGGMLIFVSGLIANGMRNTIVLVILSTQIIDNLVQTGKFTFAKRVEFGRIALVNILTTFISTGIALFMAWHGFGVWSLVATDIVAALIGVLGYYVFRPIWRPRFGWSKEVVRYFINFGSRSFLSGLLKDLLDEVDDLWTGRYLGESPLGFYSRAFTFATYPRRVLAAPLNLVTGSTYAELKGRRKRLSQAFFRVNSFLIRVGFLSAGLLALVAPEFIRLVIGEKWLPMLDAFRLMLIYTMLDPIKVTIASVFTAVGVPEKAVWARLGQLFVLLLGIFTLGPRFGIAGVALAVNVMLLVGITILLMLTRKYVEFSIRKMFVVPTFALVVGIVLGRAAIEIPGVCGSPWCTGSVKTVVFIFVYGIIIFTFERDQIPLILNMLKQISSQNRTKMARKMEKESNLN